MAIEADAPRPRSSPDGPPGLGDTTATGVAEDRQPRRKVVAETTRLRRHRRQILGAIDGGGVILQRCGRHALLGTAVFLVPVMLLDLIVANLAVDRFTSFDEAAVSVPQIIGGVDAAAGVETLLTTLALIAGSLAVALAGGVLALIAVRRSLGQPIRLSSCLRATVRASPSLLIGWVVGHAWFPIGAVVAAQTTTEEVVPFLVLMAPLVGWLVSVMLFVSPVAVIERLGPWRTMRRAVRLARSRLGTCFGFVVMSALIGGGLRLLLSSLPRLVEATGLFSFGRFGGLAEGVFGQLAILVTVPLIGLSTAMLYLQVRMDAEGIDLLLEVDRAFR